MPLSSKDNSQMGVSDGIKKAEFEQTRLLMRISFHAK
jgi:hypothetical protein